MISEGSNYAFIDGQNLHKAIKSLGWTLDYRRFRIYLREKYGVTKAFIVMGYIPSNVNLYTALQDYGFILIFKPILKNKDGSIKGNCDAELVLHTMLTVNEYTQAIIVTGDGDFYCLVKYLSESKKLRVLLVPHAARYSSLLKKAAGQAIAFVSHLRRKLEYKKAPREDGTLQGSFRGNAEVL